MPFVLVQHCDEEYEEGGFETLRDMQERHFWYRGRHRFMLGVVNRYRRSDFARLAQQSGLILCDARYFMFYLSPLYLLSRMRPSLVSMTLAQKKELIIKQQFTPINSVLSVIFAAGSSLGHLLRFPWGISILGVFKKTWKKWLRRNCKKTEYGKYLKLITLGYTDL